MSIGDRFGPPRAVALAGALLATVACGVDGGRETGPTAAPAPDDGRLAGTAWRLVAIQSMDDRRYLPDAPERYTLVFDRDGSVAIRADCNRARGDWRSPRPGGLAFGPLATTRALCPPGSLSERLLAQFPWVRSYLIENGRLYLATLADGSIIEFAPLPGPDGPAARP